MCVCISIGLYEQILYINDQVFDHFETVNKGSILTKDMFCNPNYM